jgi:hypothetical protein
MAKLHDDDRHPRIRGKFGDRIYKWYGNKCVVQKLPAKRKRRKKKSAREQATHENLRKAIAYAQLVIADASAKAYYAAAARKLQRSVFILAKADAMKAPTIAQRFVSRYYNGRADETLTVGTGDLYRVATLRVTVRDAAGDIVETGDAERQKGKKDFLYRLKRDHPRDQPLTIEVIAESRAGHRVMATERVVDSELKGPRAQRRPVPPGLF